MWERRREVSAKGRWCSDVDHMRKLSGGLNEAFVRSFSKEPGKYISLIVKSKRSMGYILEGFFFHQCRMHSQTCYPLHTRYTNTTRPFHLCLKYGVCSNGGLFTTLELHRSYSRKLFWSSHTDNTTSSSSSRWKAIHLMNNTPALYSIVLSRHDSATPIAIWTES